MNLIRWGIPIRFKNNDFSIIVVKADISNLFAYNIMISKKAIIAKK